MKTGYLVDVAAASSWSTAPVSADTNQLASLTHQRVKTACSALLIAAAGFARAHAAGAASNALRDRQHLAVGFVKEA